MKCHIHELADGKVKAPNGPNRSLLGHFIWKMDENGKVAMEGWGWLGIIGDGSGVMLACWLL